MSWIDGAVNLPAEILARHTDAVDLPAEFVVRHAVPDPTSFEVATPRVVVNTNPQDDGVAYPFQRKVWHAAGRRWVFFVWSNNFRYSSSLDGITWAASSIIRATTFSEYGRHISTWVDNEGYLHYVYGPESNGGDIRYRRGLLEAGGTITWSAAEQAIPVSGGWFANYPTICVDSGGYPWFALNLSSVAANYARIYKSDTKDGTWTTNPNYPVNFTPGVWNNAVVCPLANGQVFLYWGGNVITEFMGALCDGDGAGAAVTRPLSNHQDNWYTSAAAAIGNSVVAGMGCTDLTIHVCRWNGGVWGPDTTIQTGVQANTCPAFFKIGRIIFVTWVNTVADEIRYKLSRDEGLTWEPAGNTSYSVLITAPTGIDGVYRYSMGYETHSLLGFSYVRSDNRIMYSSLETEQAPELHGFFEVGQGSEDLPAEFVVAQGIENLHGKFEVGQGTIDLPAEFIIRRTATLDLVAEFVVGQGAEDLLAGFFVNQWAEDLLAAFFVRNAGYADLLAGFVVKQWQEDLRCRFRVENIYDLRGTQGIAFYWQGADNPPESIVDFIVESPTGFWVAEFYDGPASLRYVFIPWTQFRETGLDGSSPDMSRIDGFIWIVHTDGMRLIDYIHAPVFGDLYAFFNVRHTATPRNLKASFTVRHPATPLNLGAAFDIRNVASPLNLLAYFDAQASLNLAAQFEVGQGFNDLAAEFYVMVDRWTLIEEQIVTGADVGRVTFSGLDLNTHKNYRLVIEWYNPIAFFGWLWLFYNGDEVATNYRSQYLRGSGTFATATRYNNPIAAFSKASKSNMAVIDIGISPDGYINAISQNRMSQGADIELYGVAQNHDDIQANLTQLDVSWRRTTGAEESGFGTGSKFRLYGYLAS